MALLQTIELQGYWPRKLTALKAHLQLNLRLILLSVHFFGLMAWEFRIDWFPQAQPTPNDLRQILANY